MDLSKNPKVFSYRPSRVTNKLIQHTFKMPELTEIVSPRIQDSLARGELFAVDKEGKAIPLHVLSGILNSSSYKALQTLKEHGYSLKVRLFDLERYKGEEVKEKPYKERKKLLMKMREELPINMDIMPFAISPEAKVTLLRGV